MDSVHARILEPLTKERAQHILELFKIGKDETMVFVEDGFDYMHTLTVGKEFRRLEDEIKEKIGKCKSEFELARKLNVEWLNPQEVIDAVIKRTFVDYDGYANFRTLKNERIQK